MQKKSNEIFYKEIYKISYLIFEDNGQYSCEGCIFFPGKKSPKQFVLNKIYKSCSEAEENFIKKACAYIDDKLSNND